MKVDKILPMFKSYPWSQRSCNWVSYI